MAGKKQRRTHAPAASDAMPADLRRTDPEATRPEDLPEVEGGRMTGDTVDSGIDRHPVHDEDQEDRTPSDYEREIERIDAATRARR